MKPEEWTRSQLKGVATTHFPGRARHLERIVKEPAARHEMDWRLRATGVYRPTPSMYALALRWELGKRGPTCSVCQGAIELPTGKGVPAPGARSLYLAPRVAAAQGGRNVPQNLALGHAGCLPSL